MRDTARPLTTPRLLLGLALAVAALLPLLSRNEASAHPLGNFTINRYARIEVYRDVIRINYVVDHAEIPTAQLQAEIDSDGDGRIAQAEADRYARTAASAYASNLSLKVGANRLALTTISETAQVIDGQAGLPILRIAVIYESLVDARGRQTLTFSDANFAVRAGWKEIVVRPSAGADILVDGAFLTERSDALRQYPAESLTGAPDQREVSFAWTAGTGERAPAAVTIEKAKAVRAAGGFASLLKPHRSLGIILLSLLAAFGFGALHAFGPGHGKSVVAAYLVGSKGTARHAVALGATVTATHTSTVYLLGFVTLTASSLIAPEKLFLYLGIASGVMIVCMGAALFVGRLRALGKTNESGAHRHGVFGRAHSHMPAQVADHTEPHGHREDDAGHDEHAHAVAPKVSWRSLLTLGVAGGILPCPSAIVVMLAAISLGQVLFGMLLIVAFSLGLAGVLTGIGLALVWGKRLSGRAGVRRHVERPALLRLVTILPVFSALAVTAVGLVITYQAWNQPGL